MVERGKITPEAGSENTVSLVDDNNYSEFLKKNSLAVLVLATSWCPHCKDYEPIVSKLAQALPQVRFGLALLDKPFHTEPYWSNQNGTRIYGIPTTLMFNEGKAIALLRGSYSFGDVKKMLEEYLIRGQPIPPDEFLEALGGKKLTTRRETITITRANGINTSSCKLLTMR